eukprot:Sspe_Gene.108250::Locus_87406_Transcript_1_2_Confidence_0.667_Length_1301::g.108250::m.108250
MATLQDAFLQETQSPVSQSRWSRILSRLSRTVPVPQLPLLVHHRFNIDRKGIAAFERRKDFYHNLLDLSWYKLIFLSLAVWTFLLLFFAVVYSFVCISHPHDLHNTVGDIPDCSFADAFFFSAHTLSTTGYGVLYPVNYFSQTVATFEMWVGIIYSCILGAMAYHKLSRPSRLRESTIFSSVMVHNTQTPFFRYKHRDLDPSVDPCNFTVEKGEYVTGEPCILFRVGHTHNRQHIATQFHLYLYQELPLPAPEAAPEELTPVTYKFTELNFHCTEQFGRVRGMALSTPLPCLPFTVVHHIDEHSPLYGMSEEDFRASTWEIIAAYDALDEGCGDAVQCRHSYRISDTIFGHRFGTMVYRNHNTGKLTVDFRRLNTIFPLSS